VDYFPLTAFAATGHHFGSWAIKRHAEAAAKLFARVAAVQQPAV